MVTTMVEGKQVQERVMSDYRLVITTCSQNRTAYFRDPASVSSIQSTMPYTHALRDFNRGYRHPFLFGIHYLGGVGGQEFLYLSWLSAYTRTLADNPRTVCRVEHP